MVCRTWINERNRHRNSTPVQRQLRSTIVPATTTHTTFYYILEVSKSTGTTAGKYTKRLPLKLKGITIHDQVRNLSQENTNTPITQNLTKLGWVLLPFALANECKVRFELWPMTFFGWKEKPEVVLQTRGHYRAEELPIGHRQRWRNSKAEEADVNEVNNSIFWSRFFL